ncbi:hypothetical protein PR001_g12606 [Phytophthora rubi]|uniref:HTH psq-type domain-containing protein n=1 Tax=Phytophthora rubi TaxID=129364 RepID=A0A6A3M2J8_9STRA|nr:hypothetical protein PR001_g12606 [Phytophthora rubi]
MTDVTPSACLQLSPYLQPPHSVATTESNIEMAIPALTYNFESHLHKRKQSSPSVDEDNTRMNSFPGPANGFFPTQERREAQTSSLAVMEPYSFSSRSSSQGADLDTPHSEARSHFTGELSSSTPHRERTSRYPTEGDRKEIIARIDGGAKQVALAKEFNVSRAAISNLYKNRWEVLTRDVRDSTATHPKRSHKKASLPLAAHTIAAEAIPSPTSLDEPSTAIHADAVGRAGTPSPFQARQAKPRRDQYVYLSWPGTPLDTSQQTHRVVTMDGSVGAKRFLVHEASAHSYPCRNLVATLRDESISTVVFQQRATRLARLLI